MGANGEVETVEQEEEGTETHPLEEEDEVEQEVTQVLEGEDEPAQVQNDDSAWSKDPDYQPPSAALKKSKKVMVKHQLLLASLLKIQILIMVCIRILSACGFVGLLLG